MNKFVVKVLVAALDMFNTLVVSKIANESIKKSVELLIKRLRLFGEALTDANPDDKAQIEQIAKSTLLSPEFQELERQITADIAAKIKNEKLAQMLIQSDALRLRLFAVLGDNETNNADQIKKLFEDYLKSEEFDSMAISIAELLAEKYAKSDVMKQFFISLVTSLVNSDDND